MKPSALREREKRTHTHTQSRCLPQINHANRSAFYFNRELPSNKQFRKLRECLKRRIEAKHKYIKQAKQRCLSIKQNAAKYLAFFGLQLIFKQWKMINLIFWLCTQNYILISGTWIKATILLRNCVCFVCTSHEKYSMICSHAQHTMFRYETGRYNAGSSLDFHLISIFWVLK